MAKTNNIKRLIHILIGPAIFALCTFLIPSSAFGAVEARMAIGTVLWMAYWWITAPIDYAVTAFLPIAVNALFSLVDMSAIISQYASETILLLLGASILTVSWTITGLDKRIAVAFLGMLGTSLSSHIVFWFLLSTILSAVLPNAVVCATITPNAVSMLHYAGIKDFGKDESGAVILLSIAWGAGMGGLFSPLGGAMNLVIVDYIQKLTGTEFMYTTWVVKFLPIMIVLIVSNVIYLLLIKPKNIQLEGSKEYFKEMKKDMGKMSIQEIICLVLFAIAAILAFTRNFYATVFPDLKPAYVFIACGILAFLIVDENGERLMKWDYVQTQIVWSLMYVFAGGLAAGTLLTESGADECIGKLVSNMGLTGGLLTIFVIITVTIILSDVTSNTATAAVAVPIVISVMKGIGINPIPYIFIASIGVNLSYTLPTSVRSVPVGYGMKPSYMFKKGLLLTLIIIVLMTAMSTVLMNAGWFNY